MDRPVRWRMDSGYEVISWAESYHELDGVYPYDLEDLAQDCILSKLDGKARNLSGIRTMRSTRERLDERMRRAREGERKKVELDGLRGICDPYSTETSEYGERSTQRRVDWVLREIARLDSRTARVMFERFVNNRTFKDIANDESLSGTRVQQIVNNGVRTICRRWDIYRRHTELGVYMETNG